MELNLLLRLLCAHLLSDFILQPKSWVLDKQQKKGKSVKLYLHVALTTVLAYLFSGQYANWHIPAIIFTSHLAIDYLKSRTKNNSFTFFIVDQLAHLLILVVLSISTWTKTFQYAQQLFNDTRFWIIVSGYLFVSWPLSIIIGAATQKWRDQINKELSDSKNRNRNEQQQAHTGEQGLGLASAGKWIGICERVLILTFVLLNQYSAIGFLITAKSILRFSERESNTQLKSEYVLVGTLVSFASSSLIGVLMQLMI